MWRVFSMEQTAAFDLKEVKSFVGQNIHISEDQQQEWEEWEKEQREKKPGVAILLYVNSYVFKKTVSSQEQSVVKNLDVEKYMGRWYEIASFPTIFQPKSYVDTRATYTLNPNGTIDVLNESWNKGKRVSIEGLAYKADPKSDEAKLKVRFLLPPSIPIIPVTGDYWVLFVDDKYRYALVGHPSRNYLWILNRQPQLDKIIYNELVEKAKGQGYDISRLHLTPQSQPPRVIA